MANYNYSYPEFTVEDAIDAIYYINPTDHKTRFQVAAALAHEFGKDCLELQIEFDKWYSKHSRYDPAESKSLWEYLDGDGIKIGTFIQLAQKGGWKRQNRPDNRTEEQRKADSERAKLEAEESARKAEQKKIEKAEKQRIAAEKAKRVIAASEPATNDHPYLKRKGVQVAGELWQITSSELRGIVGYNPRNGTGDYLTGNVLIVPRKKPNAETGELELSTVEMIDGDGRKTTLLGGAVSGAFWIAGLLPEKDSADPLVLVCEGIATALTIYFATGKPTIAVGSLSNFKSVVKWLSQTLTWATPAICVDVKDKAKLKDGEVDQKDQIGMPYHQRIAGVIDAQLLAVIEEYQTCCAVPFFNGERIEGQTDFNDLASIAGIEKVRNQIELGINMGKIINFNSASAKDKAVSYAGDEKLSPEMKDMLDRYAICTYENETKVIYRDYDDFGNIVTKFRSVRGFPALYSHAMAYPDPCEKNIPASVYWDKHRKVYDRVVFRPVGGKVHDNSLTLPTNTAEYNLYMGITITPKKGDCTLILDHIREVWCNNDPNAYSYVINWLARMMQYPEKVGRTALVLRSGQGAGKNIIINMFTEAFGKHAMVATRMSDIAGRFNNRLDQNVLVFANEAVWGGDKEAEGVLKALITDEKVTIEKKGIDQIERRNHSHFIIASNNDWAAPIGKGDRRYVVLDVSDKRIDDHDYFDALERHIESGGKEAFIYHLLNVVDISEFDPKKLPDLQSGQQIKTEMLLRGEDSVTQWLYEVLEQCCAMYEKSGERPKNLLGQWEQGPVDVSRDDLRGAYEQWCNRRRYLRIESQLFFNRKLLELLGTEQKRKRVPEGLTYVYPLGDFQATQEQAERVLGVKFPKIEDYR